MRHIHVGGSNREGSLGSGLCEGHRLGLFNSIDAIGCQRNFYGLCTCSNGFLVIRQIDPCVSSISNGVQIDNIVFDVVNKQRQLGILSIGSFIFVVDHQSLRIIVQVIGIVKVGNLGYAQHGCCGHRRLSDVHYCYLGNVSLAGSSKCHCIGRTAPCTRIIP